MVAVGLLTNRGREELANNEVTEEIAYLVAIAAATIRRSFCKTLESVREGEGYC